MPTDPSAGSRSGIRRLFRLSTRRAPIVEDIDAEIAFHLDATTEALIASGLSAEAARAEALVRFGDVHDTRRHLTMLDTERTAREQRVERWSGIWQDVRYTLRGMLRQPAFTAIVALPLAIGIGANATMFGVIDRLLLRTPAHVRDDGSLTLIYFRKSSPSIGDFTFASTSYPNFATLRDSSRAFDDLAAYWTMYASLGRGIEAKRVRLTMVTGTFFTLLGVRPELGRFILPEEDAAGVSAPPVVISYGMWQRDFGGERDVIGRVLPIDRRGYTVIGVAPRGFTGVELANVDMWVPMSAAASDIIGADWATTRNVTWLELIGRRSATFETRSAASIATHLIQRTNREAKKSDSLATVVFGSIVPSRGPTAPPHAAISRWLLGVSVIVLLIACANVANLLLARAARRRREIAVRLALGVGRARFLTQLLIESMLLAALGGVGALLLSWWGGQLMRSTLLPTVAWSESPVDPRILGFTALVAIATGLLAGLAPALVASRPDLTETLKTGSREGTFRRSRLRTGLLVTQAAMSVVLLVGAGLFVRSLHNVSRLDMGFDAENVIVASVDLSGVVKSDSESVRFWESMHERVSRLPSVEHAALSVSTPFESNFSTDVTIAGVDSLPSYSNGGPYINAVTPEYLRTMGTTIIRGRGFSAEDRAGAPNVALVNEAMARTLWPAQDALGQCLYIGEQSTACTAVVGVTENIRRDNLREGNSLQYFVATGQSSWKDPGMRALFVRARGDVDRAIEAVRSEIQGMEATLPYANVRSMERVIAPQLHPWRLGATMFGIFGLLALLVAAIGLYSVIAYEVSQRTHELGVRVALGAQRPDVLRLIVGEGVRRALIGVLLGLSIAFALAGTMASLLFEVSPRDPVIYGVVAVALLLVALLASVGPALRAVRLNPVEALKAD